MLIRFGVENFLSFSEMTEFSMIAGKMSRHSDHIALCKKKRLLKGAFIFGANASGKSNLIKAVAFARNIVTSGLENTNCEKKYFRLDSTFKNRPGVFQFDIFTNNNFYSYGFAISYSDATIEEEWLYQIGDIDHCIFLRSREKDGKYSVYSDVKVSDKIQRSRFDVYLDDISNPKMSQTLFLTDMAIRSPEIDIYQPFKDVVEWFSKLIVVFPDSKYSRISQLLDNTNEKTRLETLLDHFDTGIHSVLKKEIDADKIFSIFPEDMQDSIKGNISNQLKEKNTSFFLPYDSSLVEVTSKNGSLSAFEVVSDHGNNDELFEYKDESDGTQRLFDLIPVFQKVLENCVILIDELDRSLHTKAAIEFINYFYFLADKKNTQLIITTHDSNIMDLDFIRQDEIWFVERQSDQHSELYSLNKFQTRFDKKIEKEYLLGRYGAIPIFKNLEFSSDYTEAGDSSV